MKNDTPDTLTRLTRLRKSVADDPQLVAATDRSIRRIGSGQGGPHSAVGGGPVTFVQYSPNGRKVPVYPKGGGALAPKSDKRVTAPDAFRMRPTIEFAAIR